MSDHFSTDQKILEAAPYTAIAAVYDRMMLHVNYSRWAAYVSRIVDKHFSLTVDQLLDIGCGTGRFLQEMAKQGFRGDGCDPSREMLEIARKRLPEVELYHSSLPELADIPSGRYPIMTALYDTMNYLLEEEALAASLAAVYQRLATPGIFVFDMVSHSHCKHYFRNYVESDKVDDSLAYHRESYYDTREHVQYNWIRIVTPRGIFGEMHRQRVYRFRRIKKLIGQHTGFEITGFYDDFSFDKASAYSGRAHFVLKKG